MNAEVDQRDAWRQLIAEHRLSRLGEQDLPRVTDSEQPSAAVQSGPEIVALPQLRFACVERDAYPHRQLLRPALCSEIGLNLHRAGGRFGGVVNTASTLSPSRPVSTS